MALWAYVRFLVESADELDIRFTQSEPLKNSRFNWQNDFEVFFVNSEVFKRMNMEVAEKVARGPQVSNGEDRFSTELYRTTGINLTGSTHETGIIRLSTDEHGVYLLVSSF